MHIADLDVGEGFEGTLYLTKAEIRKTKAGKPYLACTFFDGQHEYAGNVWDYLQSNVPQEGVYKIMCFIGEFNGKKQLNNIVMQRAADQDTSAFVREYVPPLTLDDPKGVFDNYVRHIQSQTIQNIVLEAFNYIGKDFYTGTSAAGMHHVGLHGNFYHTLEVTHIAINAGLAIKSMGYKVNMDLITAGALLHDIGKIATYCMDIAKIDLTMAGVLMDHVYLSARLVHDCPTSREFPEIANLLEHIILSHHSKKEFGSPVVPSMTEALVVTMADGLSAAANQVYLAVKKADDEGKTGPLTDRVFGLGNVAFVRSDYIQQLLSET